MRYLILEDPVTCQNNSKISSICVESWAFSSPDILNIEQRLIKSNNS